MNGQYYATGKVDECFTFNGINNYILVNHHAKLSFDKSDAFTIETWINFNMRDDDAQTIIGKRGSTYEKQQSGSS